MVKSWVILQSSGTQPLLSDVRKKNAIVGVISIVSSVRKCVDRASGPIALCGCRFLSNL